MFIDVKGKRGMQAVLQTLVIIISTLLLIGIVGYVIYSRLTSKITPIQ